MEPKPKTPIKVNIDQCDQMPEIARKFYDQTNLLYLQKILEDNGFNSCYAVRGIRNKKTRRYEVFDGCHRLQAMKANSEDGGPNWIWLIDETAYLTRPMAIAEGIKANKTHAAYNPIDIANNLKSLSRKLEEEGEKNKTRPFKYHLKELASITGMTIDQISNYLSLLELPREVITLIGSGRLKMSHGIELLRLPKDKLSAVADQCNKEQWSVATLKTRIHWILSGDSVGKKVCQGCEDVYDLTTLTKIEICPKCSEKIHNGELNRTNIDKHKQAEQKYLKFNAFVERFYPKEKPLVVQNCLAKFHRDWRGI